MMSKLESFILKVKEYVLYPDLEDFYINSEKKYDSIDIKAIDIATKIFDKSYLENEKEISIFDSKFLTLG